MCYNISQERRGFMPINSEGMNNDYISYFSIDEYVGSIRLLPYLLEHLESTNYEFDSYMKMLAGYDEETIINYWLLSLYRELQSNSGIENIRFDITSLADKSLFFETFNINNKRIHDLHNFITKNDSSASTSEEVFDYRNKPVNVSRINSDGSEDIFWRGVNASDVSKFMNDFIKIYKHCGMKLLFSNPFLASSLMHLLFVRIHPYLDGNGRTARVIHNIKFTEMINKLHGTRLRLSPLNLSASILVNKITYHKRLNNIYFDLKHDTNDSINKWFDFMLDMADEQIYYSKDMLSNIDMSSNGIIYYSDNDAKKSMRLSRFK